MIDIQNVTVVRFGQQLFHDFSWSIKAGEHWVVSGPNGDGKTILLELLAGKTQISKGKVHYDFIPDHDWDSYYEALRSHIRYIPAHAAHSLLKKYHGLFYQQRYYGSFNENIPLVKDIFKPGFDKLNELNIPSSLSINPLLNLPLTRLSNGQFKKVLIIKHLLEGAARILLLDYPFEGLDDESRADLSNFIDHIALAQGVQIILTDHYHHLPKVINRRLRLKNFGIEYQEIIQFSKSQIDASSKNHWNDKVSRKSRPIIEMRNLCIRYGQTTVLEDFNWTVHQGERWALTGPNGSGKTTLFSLIYADHPLAYSQKIHLFGKRRGSGESIWDIKKRVNYLGPELISFLQPKGIQVSGAEYIKSRQKSVEESSVNKILAYFQADHFMHKPVNQLSSGQLQLMLLMQCFLDDKELLLLDEPFQFLDLHQKERVSAYLQEYLDKDKTLVLITHYEEDIARWTEHLMRL